MQAIVAIISLVIATALSIGILYVSVVYLWWVPLVGLALVMGYNLLSGSNKKLPDLPRESKYHDDAEWDD